MLNKINVLHAGIKKRRLLKWQTNVLKSKNVNEFFSKDIQENSENIFYR